MVREFRGYSLATLCYRRIYIVCRRINLLFDTIVIYGCCDRLVKGIDLIIGCPLPANNLVPSIAVIEKGLKAGLLSDSLERQIEIILSFVRSRAFHRREGRGYHGFSVGTPLASQPGLPVEG